LYMYVQNADNRWVLIEYTYNMYVKESHRTTLQVFPYFAFFPLLTTGYMYM
jgi:hypothetical protein